MNTVFSGWLRFLLCGFLLCVTPLRAATLEDLLLPESLKPWVDWVRYDIKDDKCPYLFNQMQRQCNWPTRLELHLETHQGRFQSEVRVYRKSWVELPGDREHWPDDIKINQTPAALGDVQGRPALWLRPGYYRISGVFHWSTPPAALKVPAATGLIHLLVDGQPVEQTQIDAAGQLWLHPQSAGNATSREDARAEFKVFRLLRDNDPMEIITRLELEVSGPHRELVLPGAVTPEFLPLRIDSPLQARLDPDGQLHLQLRPGHWAVEISAFHRQPVHQVPLTPAPPPWPTEEVWAFEMLPGLRNIELSGGAVIDPRLSGLPEAWQRFPALWLKAGEVLNITTLGRGNTQPEPDQLSLRRELWLDFSGQGYTLEDRISGTISRSWRLTVDPALVLGRAELERQGVPITQEASTARKGIEVRPGSLQLRAESRHEGTFQQIPANGWSVPMQQAQTRLHLPPGWDLWAVFGVDQQPDTWLQRWQLLDWFLVLVTALGIGRLFGWPWGLLALGLLALLWHQHEAPTLIWTNLLIVSALLHGLPNGRASRWLGLYRLGSFIALALIALPFMIQQARTAIYPHLEQPMAMPYSASGQLNAHEPATVAATAQDVAPPAPAPAAPERALRSRAVMVKPVSQPLPRLAPGTLVASGPGLPDWHWHSVDLQWNGPVDPDRVLHLGLISPFQQAMIHLLIVALIPLLAWRLWQADSRRPLRRVDLLVLSCCLPLWGMAPDDLHASAFPDPSLLEQLHKRLNAPPECLPHCAQIDVIRLFADREHLTANLEVHAQEVTAIPLPTLGEGRHFGAIAIDGVAASELLRDPAGQLWSTVPAGIHQFSLSLSISNLPRLDLAFPLLPHRLEFSSETWELRGMDNQGKMQSPIQLVPLTPATTSDAPSPASPRSFVPQLEIRRTLHLDLDWILDTQVIRSSPLGTPIVQEVPLIPGETLTTEQPRVDNGMAVLHFGPQDQSLNWRSVLETRDTLEWVASSMANLSELWVVDASPLWHVEFSGLAPVHEPAGGPAAAMPRWRPWPQDRLKMRISRPAGVPGPTQTLLGSQWLITPGSHGTDHVLNYRLRVSQSGRQSLRLPPAADLQSLKVDDLAQPLRPVDGHLAIALETGEHRIQVHWQEAQGMTTHYRSPEVDLGLKGINHRITLNLGDNRWLLWTCGPTWGPAMLIWGLLLVILALAWGLGRTGLTPLKCWHWALLLIGLTQPPAWMGMTVVIWLLVLGLRPRLQPVPPMRFNLGQVGLALLSLGALAILYFTIEQGLDGSPWMGITGNGSTPQRLNWYQDQSDTALPRVQVYSLPLSVYRGLMLLWALWLALALIQWLRWGWNQYAHNGLWQHVQWPSWPQRSRRSAAKAPLEHLDLPL